MGDRGGFGGGRGGFDRGRGGPPRGRGGPPRGRGGGGSGFKKSEPDAPRTNSEVQVRHKDTARRNETFVTIKWKYFSKPQHSVINRTNQIICFNQPMKSDQSYCFDH